MKISEMAELVRDRISTAEIAPNAYISTDSMIPNFGGVKRASSVPVGTAIAYRAGDILFSNIRPYFRKIWLADRSGACNADVLCIRAKPEKCLPAFLYYILATESFIADYLKGCKGAKMPRGEITRLLDYEVSLPPLSVQRRIAEVLGAMDEKIAVDRRKIEELEALAKTVYDYWFVQFDFPDAHGRPYRSSGGKMTWNASLKREVPDGWEVVPLCEIADYLFGYPFDSSLFNSEGNGFPIVRIRNVKDGTTNDFTTEKAPPSSIVRNGDFLIGMDGYFDMNHWIGDDAYLVQRTCRITARNSLYAGWLSLSLCSPIQHLEHSLQGATLAHLGKAHLDKIMFAFPPEKLANKALSLLNSLIEQKVALGIANRELTLQRDALLPLLMNGQVEVA